MSWISWLIIAGALLILEILTAGFLALWIAFGAILALITSLFTSSIIVQLLVFVVSSTLFIIFTKPITQKYLEPKDVKTNSYSIIGKEAIVIKKILADGSEGQINLNGEIWTARAEDGIEILEKERVEILKLEGVKAIVKKINI